ncbi:MAG: transcriptional regulator with PAS, ATPase and Fis domain [Pirellulaceae bacterium]|jgi:transcriptional regulator with PAS, ATPase and Fis domain
MARIRSSTNALGRLLTASDRPIYVLDDQRKYIFLNAACGRWLQVDEESLLGEQANYHSSTLPESSSVPFAHLLCPPPETFSGKDGTLHLELRRADSTITRREVRFVPLQDLDSHVAGVIGIVSAEESIRRSPRITSPESAELHELLMSTRQYFGSQLLLPALIGESSRVQRVQQQLTAASAVQVSTTIVGQPGSGREALARRLHLQQGKGKAGPLIPLSCELLDAELLQSTIRDLNLRGMNDEHYLVGTILLLNVEQLSTEAQTELLGFLSLPSFSLHLIATAEQSLSTLAIESKFSSELSDLLSAIEIRLPPLVDRRQDIPLILQWLLEQVNAAGDRQVGGFSVEAMDVLVAYSWPGDISEANELVQQLHSSAAGGEIGLDELPTHLKWAIEDRSNSKRDDDNIQLDDFLEDVERELIRRALEVSRGNKALAARRLGVSRPRLLRRISHFGLE